MDLVQGKLSVTNGLIGNALFSVVDARSSPSCVAMPEYRCQEIAPSTQHAPCSYAPGHLSGLSPREHLGAESQADDSSELYFSHLFCRK